MWHKIGSWALAFAKYAFSHQAEIVGAIQGVEGIVAGVKGAK